MIFAGDVAVTAEENERGSEESRDVEVRIESVGNQRSENRLERCEHDLSPHE